MVETSQWEIRGSFSRGADKQKLDVSAEYVTRHVCKSDKYVCVFTYVHMVHMFIRFAVLMWGIYS